MRLVYYILGTQCIDTSTHESMFYLSLDVSAYVLTYRLRWRNFAATNDHYEQQPQQKQTIIFRNGESVQ